MNTKHLFVIAFVLTVADVAAAQSLPEGAECRTAFGVTACGYGCTSGGGGVVCGQYPGATCKAAYGKVACGFSCVASYGQVRCAETPAGACTSAYGKVVCNDPPLFFALNKETPRMQCVTTSGSIACGYDCKTAAGNARCAQTPRGVCTMVGSVINCFDPPFPDVQP